MPNLVAGCDVILGNEEDASIWYQTGRVSSGAHRLEVTLQSLNRFVNN